MDWNNVAEQAIAIGGFVVLGMVGLKWGPIAASVRRWAEDVNRTVTKAEVTPRLVRIEDEQRATRDEVSAVRARQTQQEERLDDHEKRTYDQGIRLAGTEAQVNMLVTKGQQR